MSRNAENGKSRKLSHSGFMKLISFEGYASDDWSRVLKPLLNEVYIM